MNIIVSQLYIEPGVYFPFQQRFQKKLSERINELVGSSTDFSEKYGNEYKLIFRMSAKSNIDNPEIKGPTVFKRDKNVEYTIFLTFDKMSGFDSTVLLRAVSELIASVCIVLKQLGFKTDDLESMSSELARTFVNDPTMIERQ